jgi:hypothetical protein
MVMNTRKALWKAAFSLLVMLVPQSILADVNRFPLGVDSNRRVSAQFFDSTYPQSWSPPAQHLGIDLPAPNGASVFSPVSGRVLLNRTARSDPFEKYLIIRGDKQGFQHVFGHINSDLEEGTQVIVGERIGAIVSAGTGPHLHWGINSGNVLEAIGAGWGWGRAPVSSTPSQAIERGWINPTAWLAEVESSSPISNVNWPLCNLDRTPLCLMAASLDHARKNVPQDQLEVEIRWAAEGFLELGDFETARLLAEEAEHIIFRSEERDFHTIVHLGAVFAGAGQIPKARHLANGIADQRDNAYSQMAGKLVRWEMHEAALTIADEIRSSWSQGVYEDIALSLFEDGRVDEAMAMLNENIPRGIYRVNTFAQFASHAFREDRTSEGQNYLSMARDEYSQLQRKSGESHLARAEVLAGNMDAALELLYSASSSYSSESIMGHLAAGAAETNNLSTAIDFSIQLKGNFGEYNRYVALLETVKALYRTDDETRLVSFLSRLDGDDRDDGWSIAANAAAEAGDLNHAETYIRNMQDQSSQAWARLDVYSELAKVDIPGALEKLDEFDRGEMHAAFLYSVALAAAEKLN